MADDRDMTVLHQPRVAWDGALAMVRASRGRDFLDYSWRVRDLLGQPVYTELVATRDRLVAADFRTGGDRSTGDLEAGRWRVRLEELLHDRPELARAVVELTARAREA